jgi:hypothetical protein
MKKRQASGPVKKMSKAIGQRSSGVPPASADISESFRRARSSIGDITTDLKQLRRRATSVVKGAQRPAKPE